MAPLSGYVGLPSRYPMGSKENHAAGTIMLLISQTVNCLTVAWQLDKARNSSFCAHMRSDASPHWCSSQSP